MALDAASLAARAPALHHLILSDELNGRPFDCNACPFSSRSGDDVYVTCALHDGRALPSAPTCTDEQWRARALTELATFLAEGARA